MASPQTITTIPKMIAPVNSRRYELYIKNTGVKDVYITRQLNASVPNIPSASNYDILLGKGEEIKILSTAQYNAVVIQGDDKSDEPQGQTSELTVMETIYITYI